MNTATTQSAEDRDYALIRAFVDGGRTDELLRPLRDCHDAKLLNRLRAELKLDDKQAAQQLDTLWGKFREEGKAELLEIRSLQSWLFQRANRQMNRRRAHLARTKKHRAGISRLGKSFNRMPYDSMRR